MSKFKKFQNFKLINCKILKEDNKRSFLKTPPNIVNRFGRKTASLTGMVALTVSSLLMAFTPVWIGIHLMTLVQSFSNILRMAFGMVLSNAFCPFFLSSYIINCNEVIIHGIGYD